MFHMFHMLHDGCIPFIFNSLLNPIVFLMFQTKINPFQNWLFPSWPRRNVYILLSFKSDRFPYVSNQNTGFKSDYFRNAYVYVSYHVLYVSWPRRNIYILFSSKSDRFPYVSNKNKAVSKLVISRTHIYMFHMFMYFMTEA